MVISIQVVGDKKLNLDMTQLSRCKDLSRFWWRVAEVQEIVESGKSAFGISPDSAAKMLSGFDWQNHERYNYE